MQYFEIIWNEESGGNVEHIAEHDLKPEDVEEALQRLCTQVGVCQCLQIATTVTKLGRESTIYCSDFWHRPDIANADVAHMCGCV